MRFKRVDRGRATRADKMVRVRVIVVRRSRRPAGKDAQERFLRWVGSPG